MKKNRAFSLVELSIVILVVGILIVGITQASRLVAQMKLSSARSLTQSSDVNGIKDLFLWLDATAKDSVLGATNGVDVADAEKVRTWNDVNPQGVVKVSFTQSDDNIRPTYKDNGINGLPTLFFNGSADTSTGNKLEVTHLSTLNPLTFTLFVVAQQRIAQSGNGFLIENRSSGVKGCSIYVDNFKKFNLICTGSVNASSSDATATTIGIANIVTASGDSTTQTLYRNGVLKDSDSHAQSPASSSVTFSIGGFSSSNFNGYISEIIIYDRVLKADERQAVEKYLSKKYGVKLS